MKAKKICDTLHDINVFDYFDTEPTLAGVVVAIIGLLTACIVVMLQCVKDIKEAKGPFDGY